MPADTVTFKDLYRRFDFGSENNLFSIENDDWRIEINQYGGDNIKLYKRSSNNSNFLKRLEIFFHMPGTIRIIAYGTTYAEKTIDPETDIEDSSWYKDLWPGGHLGEDCAAFLVKFTNLFQKRNLVPEKGQTYEVTMDVTTQCIVKVNASSAKEAKEKADEIMKRTDYGALGDIDWKVSDITRIPE